MADVALVVDNSGSIRDNQKNGQDNWKQIIDFLSELVTNLNVRPGGTRIGLVEFGELCKTLSVTVAATVFGLILLLTNV